MAERAILGFLQNNEQIPEFSAEHNLDHDQVKNVIRSLQGFRNIDAQDITRKTWGLTEEGKKYAAQGSPEKKLGELIDSFAWKYAKENKWVEMEKKQVSRKVQHVDDVEQALLLQIQEGKEIDEDGIVFLKGRKKSHRTSEMEWVFFHKERS